MNRLACSLSLGLILATAMATGAIATEADGRPPDDPLDAVHVDSAVVELPGGGQTGANLIVTGSVPTTCHHAVFEVEHAGDGVRVWLWSVSEGDSPCGAALAPFEMTIPLGIVEPGSSILLGDEPVTQFIEVDDGPTATLVGAGWSFGMCRGYCAAELWLDNASAELSGHDRERRHALFVNRGELTDVGLEQLEAAVAALEPSSLEPVYGCPDCADGGASYLLFDQGGIVSRHDMEFGAPPESLAIADELAREIMGALETCASSELITVETDCSPSAPDAA